VIAAWIVLLAVGCVGAVVFIAIQSRVRWWRTPIGRNLMAMSAVLAGMLGLSLLAFLVRLPTWLWLVGLASLDTVVWWRNWIAWRLQRRPR
jgi:hypothetical protein